MAEQAVCCEPVSTLISLFYREFTGKEAFFGHCQPEVELQKPQNSAMS